MQAEVRKLPADLQAIGKQAAAGCTDKFDELTSSVDAKGNELVDTLATKYNEALKAVDAEIEAEKEKNKGLIVQGHEASEIARRYKRLTEVLAKITEKTNEINKLKGS